MRKRQHTSIVLLRRRHLSMRSRTGCVCGLAASLLLSGRGAWELGSASEWGRSERRVAGAATNSDEPRGGAQCNAVGRVARKGGTLSTTAGVGTRTTRIRMGMHAHEDSQRASGRKPGFGSSFPHKAKNLPTLQPFC
jgi:hypothetical protein